MSLQDTSFLQSQLEQILDFHRDLSTFENSYRTHLVLWSEIPSVPRLEIIKKGRIFNLFAMVNPSSCSYDLPSLKLEISSGGKWNVLEMKNSRFEDEIEYANHFDYWDCLVRFDNFNDGFTESLPA